MYYILVRENDIYNHMANCGLSITLSQHGVRTPLPQINTSYMGSYRVEGIRPHPGKIGHLHLHRYVEPSQFDYYTTVILLDPTGKCWTPLENIVFSKINKKNIGPPVKLVGSKNKTPQKIIAFYCQMVLTKFLDLGMHFSIKL